MLQWSFVPDGRRVRAQGVLLRTQPEAPELPRALRDADVDQLLDRYMQYKGMGTESLALRLVARHTRLLPSARRGATQDELEKRVHSHTERLAKAARATDSDVARALTVKAVSTDTNNKIPVMIYGSLVGQPPFRAAFIGPTGCGKSTLVAHLVAEHYGEWFASTGGGVHYFSKTLSTDEIAKDPKIAPYLVKKHAKFDEGELRTLIDEQKHKVKERGKDKAPHVLVILSDFASEEERMKSPIMKELFMSGRHYNISIVIDTQKLNALPPAVRNNCQLFFAFECAGYEEELYERNLRVRNMPVSAFRDVVQYALEPTEEQKRETEELAKKRGVMVPEFQRVSTFLTVNLQAHPAFAYRRGLAEVLPLVGGWVSGELAEAVHGRNPAWYRREVALQKAKELGAGGQVSEDVDGEGE